MMMNPKGKIKEYIIKKKGDLWGDMDLAEMKAKEKVRNFIIFWRKEKTGRA